MASGLDPGTIARLIDRHGSLPAAAERATRDPRFATELRATKFEQVLAPWDRETERHALEVRYWRLVAAWDSLLDDDPVDEPDEEGAFLSLALIEEALRMHDRDGCGRRTLAKRVPGLTEWYAGQLLRWYGVGQPDGLWFDERDRLQVGAKVAPTAPTRGHVRLPRI